MNDDRTQSGLNSRLADIRGGLNPTTDLMARVMKACHPKCTHVKATEMVDERLTPSPYLVWNTTVMQKFFAPHLKGGLNSYSRSRHLENLHFRFATGFEN